MRRAIFLVALALNGCATAETRAQPTEAKVDRFGNRITIAAVKPVIESDGTIYITVQGRLTPADSWYVANRDPFNRVWVVLSDIQFKKLDQQSVIVGDDGAYSVTVGPVAAATVYDITASGWFWELCSCDAASNVAVCLEDWRLDY